MHTIPPHTGIFSIAQMFVEHRIRTLPVVDSEVLAGQVWRQELMGIGRCAGNAWADAKTEGQPGLHWSATDSAAEIIARKLRT